MISELVVLLFVLCIKLALIDTENSVDMSFSAERKKQKISEVKTGIDEAEALVHNQALDLTVKRLFISSQLVLIIFRSGLVLRFVKWTWRLGVYHPMSNPFFLSS